MKHLATLLFTFVLSATAISAQDYPQIVIHETSDAESATFTSLGVAKKSKDVADNAAQSLFYTLFYDGVDGVNGGRPLITTDNQEYVKNFLDSRYHLFVRYSEELEKLKVENF